MINIEVTPCNSFISELTEEVLIGCRCYMVSRRTVNCCDVDLGVTDYGGGDQVAGGDGCIVDVCAMNHISPYYIDC